MREEHDGGRRDECGVRWLRPGLRNGRGIDEAAEAARLSGKQKKGGGRSRPLGCWSERVYAGSFQARGSRSCTVVFGSVGKKSNRRFIDPSRLMNAAPIRVQ